MVYAAIALLTVGAVLFIVHPMVSKKRRLLDVERIFDFGDLKQRQYLHHKKALTLENLKDLDFEYEMGKLSDEDYERLRRGYLREAQETLQEMDNLKVKEEIEELIETDVRFRRRIQ